MAGNDEDQGQMGGVSAPMSIRVVQYAGHGRCPPRIRDHLAVFDEVSIRLDKRVITRPTVTGPTVIRTYGNSDKNCYIQRARPTAVLNNFWFPHEEFARGGLLELWLGPSPTPAGEPGNSPE